MDDTVTKAPDVSVLADGLAVSHYVEALEARTPRSPRKTGSQAPREVAAGVQPGGEAQDAAAPSSPSKAEEPCQDWSDIELDTDVMPGPTLPCPSADRTDAEPEASPNDFCLSPVAGTGGYASAAGLMNTLHSVASAASELSPVAWSRRGDEFQFSPVVVESLAGGGETMPFSEAVDEASAHPSRLHALTPSHVQTGAVSQVKMFPALYRASWHCGRAMDKAEARTLVERCLPRFKDAGLEPLDGITDIKVKAIASLWAGMGCVYDLMVTSKRGVQHVVAKRVQLPKRCDSIGDQRKKDSYDVEAAFYQKGHAERLISAGCMVPFPLHVEHSRGEGVTICMTKVEGKPSHPRGADAFVAWLARLHSTYWGSRADEACGPDAGGLQLQGCYWHLDTRPDEHRKMPSSGWMGRLKLCARAIDLRLKADPMQSVCHGDAKGANILFANGEGGEAIPLVYDFQYCGKAAVTKDLAYFFNVEAYPNAAEEERLLRLYHAELTRLLTAQGDIPPQYSALRSFSLVVLGWVLQTLLWGATDIGLGLLSGLS
ncbi:unnamed protein product [Symbiodinium natans]|uniref:CHK kinase-like domain-containing protein n=1 Tax=Symbiodinium natans TaxID=878477 RepID=A0A812QVE7_9DINO|nr:unnamed protein product [Symbiodinium natans]